MDKALYDQTTNLLEKSQKILILTHAKADCDALGAALSSYLIFSEMGKEVTVATNDPAPDHLLFLPSVNILQNSLANSTDFIITVDTAKTALGKMKYNVEGDKMNIILTPKNGTFSAADVSFGQGKNKFDLIFVLDAGNLEHLGPLYDQNVEMFFETPVINIDHHSSNTDFGQVNMVDVTAASTTEVLYYYFKYLEKKLEKKLITEDIATLLLAGIITDTGSFQHTNTSPQAMETSSQLLDLGARQQEIIKNIYKTKKLSTLKLWGIILSKVQTDPVHRMVWSSISADDLREADAQADETEGILDDLLTNAPGAEVIFLIKENPTYVSVSMRSTTNSADVGQFCAENGGGGHVRAAGFKVRDGRPFEQIMSEVLGKVRAFQSKRLNLHPEDVKPPMPTAPEAAKPTAGKQEESVKPTTEPSAESGASEKKPEEKPSSAPVASDQKPLTEGKTTYLDFKVPSAMKENKPESNQKAVQEKKPEVQPANEKAQPSVQPVVEKKEPSSQPSPAPEGARPVPAERPRAETPTMVKPIQPITVEPKPVADAQTAQPATDTVMNQQKTPAPTEAVTKEEKNSVPVAPSTPTVQSKEETKKQPAERPKKSAQKNTLPSQAAKKEDKK